MNQLCQNISRQPIVIPAPRAIISAGDFAELAAAFASAAPDVTTQITITASFPLSGNLSVAGNRRILLASGTGGPFTLTRDVTGHLFTAAGPGNNVLGLGNIIIDGNYNSFPNAAGSLIHGESGSTILLAPGAELVHNHTTVGAGAISAEGTVQLSGGRIAENQGTFGGGIGMNAGNLVIYGGVIENNVALYNGGGVYSGTQFALLGGQISGNRANQGGGGISIDNGMLIMENGIVQGNTCDGPLGGGGIYIGGATGSLRMLGGMVDSNSSLQANGGGIQLASTAPTSFSYEIGGSAILSNNSAPTGNGGAIGIDYARLPLLNVGGSVLFTQNSASQAYQIAPADIPTHDTHILTHRFTSPFVYGYNNFDIEYTQGTPVPQGHLVNFDSAGGGQVPSQIVAEGGLALRPADPVRGCDVFLGWYTDAMLTMAWDFVSPVTQDMTLYARWQPVVCPPGYQCQPGEGCVPASCQPCCRCRCNPCSCGCR